MPTENRSSNTEQMVSVPRELLNTAVNGYVQEQGHALNKLRDLLAQPAAQFMTCTHGDKDDDAACMDCLNAWGQWPFKAPAVQHQGEPVAWRYREHGSGKWSVTQESPGSWYMGAAGYEIEPLHTHADSGEVERLREGIAKHWKVICDQRAELDTLRVRWSEARTLLLELEGDHTLMLQMGASEFGQKECKTLRARLLKLRTYLRTNTEPMANTLAALSASAEQSAPVERGPWQPVTAPGQIQEGAWLSFTVAGSFICAQARLIINPGTAREEIIYNRQKNHYFVTSMAIDGTSTHKGVLVAKAQV